jgi:hypothetical protein
MYLLAVANKRTQAKQKPGKHPGGRPTDFLPEYSEQARNLALLGLTDKQMSEHFGITVSTFNLWKLKHPQFSESLKEGKVAADAKVAYSLYQRAIGFTITVEKVVDGEIQPTKEFIPGDPGAQKLWLINRQREHWQGAPDVTLNVKNEMSVDVNKPAEKATAEESRKLAEKRGLINSNGHLA